MKLKDLFELDYFTLRELTLEDTDGSRHLQPIGFTAWYDDYTETYYADEIVMNAFVIGIRDSIGGLEVIIRF